MKKSIIAFSMFVLIGIFAFSPLFASVAKADDVYQPEGEFCDKAVSFLFYVGPIRSEEAYTVAIDWALNYVAAYHCSI